MRWRSAPCSIKRFVMQCLPVEGHFPKGLAESNCQQVSEALSHFHGKSAVDRCGQGIPLVDFRSSSLRGPPNDIRPSNRHNKEPEGPSREFLRCSPGHNPSLEEYTAQPN